MNGCEALKCDSYDKERKLCLLDGPCKYRVPDCGEVESENANLRELCRELWGHSDYSNALDRDAMKDRLEQAGVTELADMKPVDERHHPQLETTGGMI